MVRSLLRRSFKHRRVAICPNADWMVPILNDAFGDIAKVCFVPFGIEPSWYEMHRSISRTVDKDWLCVTRLTRDKIGTLFEWGAPFFSGAKRSLHLFGPMQEEMPLPDWVHYHGPVTPEVLRDEWFPRVHGLITLSQHSEGRPQVMLEAMAAGLPIIASDLPAHVDIIQHGLNGMICKGPAEVGTALETLEDGMVNRRMGEQGRAWVSREIGTWDDCAGRYANLYHELLCESRI
ncbi:glycosyltransferase family 4 protein [Luteimonas sp. 8-5]|uniref:glycosyltransferase family 4 protein n=1 Tax=Luteimonas sp. 8-5 TaxID=3039387 RepID=UPI0024372EFB|nr:glycosyltransferase family 4 protein [Luteimonas sp. 8-5]MDG6347839.1 glycosyltransferase family 4 protein [Luteimonas sp. 8-5]